MFGFIFIYQLQPNGQCFLTFSTNSRIAITYVEIRVHFLTDSIIHYFMAALIIAKNQVYPTSLVFVITNCTVVVCGIFFKFKITKKKCKCQKWLAILRTKITTNPKMYET